MNEPNVPTGQEGVRPPGARNHRPDCSCGMCARKLLEMEPDKPNLAKGYIVDRAIDDAPFILERIEKRWPSE